MKERRRRRRRVEARARARERVRPMPPGVVPLEEAMARRQECAQWLGGEVVEIERRGDARSDIPAVAEWRRKE